MYTTVHYQSREVLGLSMKELVPTNATEIRKQYALGQRNFKNVQLRGANLKSINLSFVDLREADLSHANLTEANLSGSDLRGTILNEADLHNANLRRVNLTGASLTKTNLNQAILSKTQLNDACLVGAFLTKACLDGANLNNANLTKAHLNAAKLRDTNLSEANLSEAYLIGAYLSKINLTQAYLNDAYLNGVDLSHTTLTGAYYNDNTRFDASFDPIKAGMVKAKTITIEELLNTFNYFNQLSHRYLGKTITLKHWESSRPSFDWLNQFELNASAQITCSGNLKETVNILQLKWSQQWINNFIQICSQIIQDFPNLIDQKQFIFVDSPQKLSSSI